MKQARLHFVRPTQDLKEKAEAFKQSFFACGEQTIDGSEKLDRLESYEEWLSFVGDNAKVETLRPRSILTDTFFAMDAEEKIVGIIDLRYELNDFFKDFGNCGYSVAPEERRRGYATEMLAMVCSIAREAGLESLRLSALRSNIPSVRTIQKNGGIYERSFSFAGEIADVYCISLK